MATIHIDTDLLRRLGSVFVQNNEQINQFQGQIQNTISQVEGDWQGVNRQRFEQIFQDWRAAASRIVTQGEDIGRHLQNTAQLFDNADTQNGGGSTGTSGSTGASSSTGTSGSTGTTGTSSSTGASGSTGTSGTSSSTGTSGNQQATSQQFTSP